MKGLRFVVMSLSLLFGITFSFAQKQTNIWYFGLQAGLDFNSGSPIALTNNALPISEWNGSASFSDQNGNLLFYSDGKTILNRNHELMLNGTLFSQYESRGVNMIVAPKPGSSSIYYLFYIGLLQNAPSNIQYAGLMYSEIDMSLDNGLGGVTISKKNSNINSNGFNLSATLHANGHDIWLVSYEKKNRTFYSYLISDSGISVTPITSVVGVTQHPNVGGWTYVKLAPNGKKLFLIEYDAFLFDFNNANGMVVGNPLIMSFSDIVKENYYLDLGYAEFSASGNVLYISARGWEREGGALYQFDLNASDIAGSKVVLATSNQYYHWFNDLQIGTDQKIYVSVPYSDYLSVINAPETLGLGCGLDMNGMYLNGRRGLYELPHFIQSYSNRECMLRRTNPF